MMPGTASLPQWAQIVFWAVFLLVGGLVALCVFWVKRYIDGKDARDRAADEKLSRHEGNFAKIALELATITSAMKIDIASNVAGIEKGLSAIGERTASTLSLVESLQKRVDQNLSALNTASRVQQKQGEEIKTVKKKLSDHAVLISQIVKKKDPK